MILLFRSPNLSMFRHSISSRFTLLTRQIHPSLSHPLLHADEDKSSLFHPLTNLFAQREFHSANRNAVARLGAHFRERGFTSSLPMGLGSSFCNYSSSTIGDDDKIEYMSDVTSVLTDKTLELASSQTPIINEVAVAAVDSFFPVAALQYFIGGIHDLTGLNWWAAIALTTLTIRSATIPILIKQLKATYKLTLMRPQLEEIRQQMLDSMDPKAAAEGQMRMKALFKEHGVTPFTPLKGMFIQGPVFISFYLAISNMVEKVPSFKGGGTFWFTDLTTPDALYIFPVLTALTFLITVEMNMQEGLEGNPIAGTMKNFSRVLAVLTVPFTMNFPKAIFCYWITSNLFSLVYGLVIKRPPVKKFLGLPEIVQPPTTSPQPNFSLFKGSNSLFGGLKSLSGESSSVTPPASPPPIRQSKLSDGRISSSSPVISQRLGNLEKTVKGTTQTKNR